MDVPIVKGLLAAGTPDNSVAKRRLINLAALALALGWWGLIALTITPYIDDFKYQWQASVNLMQSGDPYTAQPGYERNHMLFHDPATGARKVFYLYPPFLAYFLQPFGLIDSLQAQWLWFGLNSIVLGLFIGACIWVSGSGWARRYWGLVVLGTLLAPPTRLSLQLGQISIVLALLMVASFGLAYRRPRMAGGLLAVATLIKLYPGLLGVYYLLCRPRKVVWWGTAIGAGVAVLPALTYGSTPYLAFLNVLLRDNYYPYSAEFNISILGFWDRLLVAGPYAVPLTEAPLLARALAAACALGVLGFCLAAPRELRAAEGRTLQVGAWLCAMLLLTPANGYYNLVLLLLPCLAILRYLELSADRHVRTWLVIATALVCIPTGWTSAHPWLYQTLHIGWGLLVLTPPLYGLLLYFIVSVQLARRFTGGLPVPAPATSPPVEEVSDGR